jgi:cyclopropane fatty-acyl-phospholipid synthase-like methyltransferase
VYSRDFKKIYDHYYDVGFKQANILSIEAYEKACLDFDALYGRLLPRDRDAGILDIGCGAGHFLYYLAKKGYRNFLGLDISRQQIEFCKRYISKKVELTDAFEFLQGKVGIYATIIAQDVLEHIPKAKTLAFIELVYESLNRGGLFILRVPNMSNPFSLDSRFRDFTHETGFTEKSLYQVLASSGFEHIEVSSTEIHVRSFRTRIRRTLVRILYAWIRFLYYIQDFSVPMNLGKNLVAICKRS